MPTFDQTQLLFDDKGFEEELRRRQKWSDYQRLLGSSIYPEQTKKEFRKQLLFKDLGFTGQEYKDGRAELGMVQQFGLPENYSDDMLMDSLKGWVEERKKDQEDFVGVFQQYLDEEFNQADRKHYTDPRMNGLRQRAVQKVNKLNSHQKQFLNNVMKVATQDGFQFASTAGGTDVNTTLEGVPRMDLLLESWAAMSPQEKNHVRQFLPFVAESAWAKAPEREADFSQMVLEGAQDIGEDLIGGLAFMSSAIADVTIRKAMGTRISDEEKHRLSEQEKLSSMLKQLRAERRGKIQKGTEFLGFDTGSFKQQLAGTVSEMGGMALGPLMAVSKAQMFREESLVEDPTASLASQVFGSTAKGVIYYRAGRAQLKYLAPSRLGGPKLGQHFLKNTLKRFGMEVAQEAVQEGAPLVIDQMISIADDDVSAPNWGNKLREWKEIAPEAAVMMFLLSGAASGADVATQASRSRAVSEQTADPDMLVFNGVKPEAAEEIANMESPEARFAAVQELAEAGEIDTKQDIPEEVVQRVREKLRAQMDREQSAGPELLQMPNGDIRIDFPDNTTEVVATEEDAVAAIDNWREQLKDSMRQELGKNLDVKMEELTRTEIERIGGQDGVTIEAIPEEQRSLRALVDSGALPADAAANRITDLAHQQVASGEVDMDPDAYAEILLNDFASGERAFEIQGRADPGAFIDENGVLNAAIGLNPDATVETVWEEALENHAHAMLNGQHWDMETLRGWLEEVEEQTGTKFIAGDTREQLIEAFSFVGRSYATGEMKSLSAKLKSTFDALLDVLMTLIGISRQIDALRQQGAFNPELEANIRAGLGIDGGEFYSSLVAKAEKKQGVSNPTQSISVSTAANLAAADGVSETTKEGFYGDIWIKYLRKTGQFDDTTPKGMAKAANAMIDDLLEFMADRPEFLGYYNEDWQASRDALDQHYGGVSDNDFAMYRFLVGIMSPSTPLNKNILEAVSAFDWMFHGRDYDDAVRIYLGPKGNFKGDPTGGGFNILNPQGATWVTKARNVKVVHQIMADLDLDWVGFQKWMGQRSTHKELTALRQKYGFGTALSKPTMLRLLIPSGEVGITPDMTEAQVDARIKELAKDEDITFPNGFFFGKKVGPYTLNSMGYPQYSTVDIWESRAIRSYLGLFDSEKKMLDLPKASEDALFSRFIITFRAEFKKRFPDIRADINDLQALRWFYMIGESNKAGFKYSAVETISRYTSSTLQTMGSTGFQALAKGVGDGSALPASLLVPTRLTTPVARKGTFSLAPRRQLYDMVKDNPDGFTIDPRTGEMVTTGWVVAPRKHTETELKEMTQEDFYKFLDDYGPTFRNDDQAYFGGWLRKDDDTYVLDVATTYEEGAEAAKVADENEQDAIFHLDTFTEVGRADFGKEFPGFEQRTPAEKGIAKPLPNYVAPMVEHVNFEGTDYEARFTRETVDGLGPHEMVHFLGHHTPAVDHIKVQVAGSKGAEKKTYREYPEIYTKRAYVAFNGYKVETQYGIRHDKGYRIPVHESNWYPADDPLNLREQARVKAEALGYGESDSTAVNELYMAEIRDAGFLGFKSAEGTVGVILRDVDVMDGVQDPIDVPTMSIVDQDKKYAKLVEDGNLDAARDLVRQVAEERGIPILHDAEAFDLRRGAAPKQTVKAYKLFRVENGELFPLFVGAKSPIPMGQWLDAKAGPETTAARKSGGKAGTRKVKSRLGPLAYRPGWHAGDIPLATHIGVKSPTGEIVARRENEVWAEVEMADDVDWQTQATANGMKNGKFRSAFADIKEMPSNGHYRYKTNPNMTGEWLISGSMKVNRVLTEHQANKLITRAGQKPMPWDGGKLVLRNLGLSSAAMIDEGKILDVTYDDKGKLIPLSKRFNMNDPRATFSLGTHPIKGVHQGFTVLESKPEGVRMFATYKGGKGYVQVVKTQSEVLIENLIASDQKMVRGIINDLRQEFEDRKLIVTGVATDRPGSSFWGGLEAEGKVDGYTRTFSITGKKGGKAVPKNMALLGIVDDNMRVKTKVTKQSVYHDEAFGSYASARAMSRFRVLDNKTILFMDDPGPAKDAIDFELEYLGYEIKTVEGAGRSNWTWSIKPDQPPKWPGSKDGGKLAQWFDRMDEWEARTDQLTPLMFDHGGNLAVVVPALAGGRFNVKVIEQDTRNVVEEREFDSRLHAVVYLAREGAQELDYFDYNTFALNPGLRTLAERVQEKAEEQDLTGSPGGVDAFLKMLVNLERLIDRNNRRVSHPKSQKAKDRLSLTQDLAAYDAMLKALPPAVRARLGGWATLASKAKHETRVKFLHERLPMMEKHLDRFLRKTYLEQIDTRIKRQKVKVENGVPKGRDADMHARLDEMEAIMEMSASEVEAAERRTEDALVATADPDSIVELTDRLVMLQMFGGLRAKGDSARPAADVAEALAEVDQTIATGLTRYRAREEARLRENAAKRESIIDDISRGEGLLDPSEAKRRAPNMKTLKGKARDLAQQYFFGMTSWEWMLNWAMGRRQKALQNDNVRRLGRMAHKATHAENRRNIAHTELMSRKLASIFGIKTKGRWRYKLSRKLEEMKEETDTGIMKISLTSAMKNVEVTVAKARQIVAGEVEPETFGLAPRDIPMLEQMLDENDARRRPRGDNHRFQIEKQKEGPLAEMRLSQDQAIYLYMMWKQEGPRQAMKRWGYTDQTMDQIFNFLTPESVEIEAWLRTQYDANWHELNPVYRSRFGVNMPRIKNYSPTSYVHMGKQEVEMLLEETTPGASTTPGFAKARQRHHAQPREDLGALDSYTMHMRQSSHFINWAEPVADFRQQLQHKDVQTALEQHGGRHLKNYINERIDFFADGGNRVKNLWVLDAIRKKFTVLALSWNWGVMMKQLSSQPAFLFDNDPGTFLKYQAKFFMNPVENFKKMWAMPFVQERFHQGFDRDVMLAMSGKSSRNIFNWILETGMITGRTGDIIPVIIGGYTVYQSHYDAAIRRGATPQVADAEAQVAFEMSVERAQQAGDIKDLSSFQQGGSVNRIFTMFLTSPLQYYMNTYHAIANLGAEGGKMDLAKRILISHIILPWTFQFISDLVRWPQDDEDEDLINPADYVRAMFLGPLNGMFILGHGLTVGTGHATNALLDLFAGEDAQKTRVWGYQNPVVQMTQETLEGAGDVAGGLGDLVADPSLSALKDVADGAAEAGKLYGPLGVYDVGSRLIKSLGLMDELNYTLLPTDQKLAEQIRDAKKDAYKLREDEYKEALELLKADKDNDDAKELKREIQEERWEQYAYLLVQRLRSHSQEDITSAIESLPQNHIPTSVKEIAFPELDYIEPEE